MIKPQKTDTEKRQAQIAKMKASLVLHRASAFNVALVREQKFTSGIFRSN